MKFNSLRVPENAMSWHSELSNDEQEQLVLIQPPLGILLMFLQYAYWSYVGCGIHYLGKVSVQSFAYILCCSCHYTAGAIIDKTAPSPVVHIQKEMDWGYSS